MSQKPSIITIVLVITIFGFLAAAKTITAAPATSTLQVGDSSDDVRVRDWFGWSISIVADSGRIGHEGIGNPQRGGIGMRFTGVDIPPGSTIDSAKLELRAHGNNNQIDVMSKIRAEDTGDAQTFSDIADYQGRPRTAVQVSWDNIGPWAAGTWYESPDITDVIQAVVNRADWVEGNAMVIFFDDHDGLSDSWARRNVSLYDSNPGFAPRLIIGYTPYERCVKPPGWNDAEEDCYIEVTYEDPMPGSGLQACSYRIGSKIGEPDIYDMPPLFDSVVCIGTASTTAKIIMEVGSGKACHAVGEAACKIETEAYDFAANLTTASSTYNILAYRLSVSSLPITSISVTSTSADYASNTDYEISDIPSGTDIELTAPATHIDGGDTYHFEDWTNCNTTTDYTCEVTMNTDKTVTANFGAGPPPPTPLPVTWNHCDIEGLSGPKFNWDYNPIGVESQAAYHIIIHGAPLDFDLEVDPGGSLIYAAPSDYVRDNLDWGVTYSWEIMTKDGGHWSNPASGSFTMPANAYPWIDLTSSDTFDWMPKPIRIGEVIQFYSTSTCYNPTPTGAVCDPPATFEWTFEHGSSSPAFVKDPTVVFDEIVFGGNEITLEVCDGSGLLFEGSPYCCLKDSTIAITLSLPEYREVAPVTRLDNFLARIINIFARF